MNDYNTRKTQLHATVCVLRVLHVTVQDDKKQSDLSLMSRRGKERHDMAW